MKATERSSSRQEEGREWEEWCRGRNPTQMKTVKGSKYFEENSQGKPKLSLSESLGSGSLMCTKAEAFS